MEVDKITHIKVLSYTVENFISCIKCHIPPEILATEKVFCEIVKRSQSITESLKNITKTTLENSDLSKSEINDMLNDEIEKLVQSIILQDFIELALIGQEEIFNISESELQNFLFAGCVRDITSLTPSTLEMGSSFHFHMPLSSSPGSTPVSPFDNNFNCLLLSTQFENSRKQFDEELLEMRRISENGFTVSDLTKYNVANILKYEESSNVNTKINPQKKELKCFALSIQDELNDPSISVLHDYDSYWLSDVSEDADSFLSWEGCLGKFQQDHSYISEVTPEEAARNISEKEYQTYFSLLSPTDALSEEDMVRDILDLLIGIPSNTFYFDIHARKFRMKYGVHLPNISPECTAKFVVNFIDAGSIYYALQKFCKDFLHSSAGLVLKGMQLGIQQILSMYKEYIVAVKVNRPSMLFLQSDVSKNAELLQSFGIVCGIDPDKMIFSDVPKGLGLLSYLHDIARSHKRKENGIMIAVLLKYAYTPYFNFLNEWMTDGTCNDPYGEFQIMEDFDYLNRRDALYWKFAYTENIDDPSRVVPPEIKHYSQGILDCGKSIGLLKLCCPELSSLKFLYYKPPPSLSMVYSFPAAIEKQEECMDYIRLKETADSASISSALDVSVDHFLIENQKYIDRKSMLSFVKRRYDLIAASMAADSNMLNFHKASKYLEDNKTTNFQQIHDYLPLPVSSKDLLSSCFFRNIGPLFSSCELKCDDTNTSFKLLCAQIFSNKNNKDLFNGKMLERVGVLFSSCGYFESDMPDSLSENIEHNFSPLDFSKQLSLTSYNQYSSVQYKENSEKEYLNSFGYTDRPFMKGKPGHISENGILKYPHKADSIRDIIVTEDNKTKNIVPHSFLDKLTSLLISEYGDLPEDVYSCIQVTSLQRLMMHNFNAVLKMRIHLIESLIMIYIVKKLRLDLLLSSLRNIYFFQDEGFNQSLCEPLFSLVMKCRTPREFANWPVLNEILVNALANSRNENNLFASCINANLAYIPEDMPIERTDFLRLFVIEFQVQWPLNIIVHQACIQQYLKIFSVLLEIEFLCWLLGRIWRTLIVTSKSLHLDDSPQFRQIMLKRFDMDQFIRVIRNSIHQHLQGPLWEFLSKSLSAEESSIDALENIHLKYLEAALARCFLTDETHVLHQLLSTMCHQIFKFCSAVSECVWEKNSKNGHYETYIFKGLSAAFDTYKQYQRVFLKCIMKETLTKKCGRYWDRDYQDFLETVLETERNIS